MGIFNRLKSGLSKSSRTLGENLGSIIRRRRLDKETLQELEELLITSDLGLSASADRFYCGHQRSSSSSGCGLGICPLGHVR